MRINRLPTLNQLARNWFFWLIVITGAAIAIRSIPAWMNSAWGADFGIYYGLTSRFIDSQQIYGAYDGWGGSYNYFPVLYIISALGHWLTGMDLMWVMPKIAPIFGGLAILVFYFIVYEITKKRNIALLSSVFLAVIPLHAYQTSHAAPLTIGHFFMILSLYLYLKYTKDNKYLLFLMISTLLLIMSHHLTTYFFLIILFSILVFKSVNTSLNKMSKDIMYFTVSSAMIFSYWIFIATPVFDRFVRDGMAIQPYQVIILFYVFVYATLLGVYAIQKYKPSWISFLKKLVTFDSSKIRKRALIYFFASVLILLCIEFVFLFVNFPVSGIRMKPLSIVYSLPIVFFIGFAFMGLEYLRYIKNRWFIQAWLCATLGSFVYSLLTNNATLYPDRHVEYFIVPMSFVVAVGIIYLFKEKDASRVFLLKKRFSIPYIKVLFVIVVSCIVFSNAVAVYPVYNSLEWMDESISEPTINTIGWIKENIDSNNTVFATDLRLSKLLWAEGFNSTYEFTNETWWSKTWEECRIDLDYEENHSRVTHILIDDVMRDTSVNVDVMFSIYMTNESYLKFQRDPFDLVYRNATVNDDFEETHWAEVYSINWKSVSD